MKTNLLSQLLVLAPMVVLLNSAKAKADPWPYYGRTYPSSEYIQVDADGNTKTVYSQKLASEVEVVPRESIKAFRGYVEPNFEEGLSYENPFSNPNYQKYELIVVVNSNMPSSENPDGQKMRVYLKDRGLVYFWNISTGMDEFGTGEGEYTPLSFSHRHWSGSYDAPMLWSVFFSADGKALHSSLDTDSLRALGVKRSSRGCIHIEEYRAEVIYNLVGQIGKKKTRIIVK